MFLLEKATQVTRIAIASRHMRPIKVSTHDHVEESIHYVLRIAEGLKHKPQPTGTSNPKPDPFLPYEAELHVADIAPAHVCLLNKYPVIANHLLLITRDFEPQESLLTEQDFMALTQLLDEADGLVFYNCGASAGASQSHKHLQWVPRTLGECRESLPLEPGLQELHFSHYWLPLQGDETADTLYQRYQQALRALAWRPGLAYNLLLTRQWLLLVPRHSAYWNGISINSLAFVGSFFVMDNQQAEQLRATGFQTVLQAVSGWPD
jgi:ATP adenylyltransferase